MRLEFIRNLGREIWVTKALEDPKRVKERSGVVEETSGAKVMQVR